MATITNLNFRILTRYNGDGMARARRDVQRTQNALNANTTTLRSLQKQMGGLYQSIATLAPAALPVANAVAGVAAGFGALAITAGTSMAIYGKAVQTGITKTMDMAKNGEKLSGTQKVLVKNVKDLQFAWNKLSISDKVLLPANDAISGLRDGIKKLPKLIDAMFPSVKKISQAFQNWMRGDGFDNFLRILIRVGVPAFDTLRRAAVNVLAVMGHAFRAALPMVKPLTQAILDGSAALRKWAEGGGFARWMDSSRKQMPAVAALFRAVGTILMNWLKATAPLGPVVLQLVTLFAQLIAAIPVPVLTAVYAGFLAWKAALLGLMVINIIKGAVTSFILIWRTLNFVFMASPIGFIIGALALLGVGLFFLITKCAAFRNFWVMIWNGIRTAAVVVAHAVAAAWNWVLARLTAIGRVLMANVFMPIGRFFTSTIPAWASVVRNSVVAAWNWIWLRLRGFYLALYRNVFAPVGRFFAQTIPRWASVVRNSVVAAWGWIWARLRGFYLALYRNVFAPIGRFFTNTIPRWASNVRNSVVAAWNYIWVRLRGFYNAIYRNVFAPIGRFFTGTIPRWANNVKNAIVKAWNLAVSGVKKAWNWLSGIVKKPINIAIGFINHGIIDVWNKVAGFVGLKKQGHIKKLAKGGPVHGPGHGTADKVPALLSNNEHVWTAREVAAAGGHKGVAALRSAVLNGNARTMGSGDGRYAEGGGVIAPKPPKVKGAGGSTGRNPQNYDPNAKNIFSSLGDLVRGSIGAVANPILDRIIGWIRDKVGGGKSGPQMRKIMAEAAVKPLEWIKSWIDDDDAKHAFANGFTPWKKWKEGDGRHVRWRGHMFNVRTVAMLRNAEKVLKSGLHISQGSFSSSVGASAGTHSGGGAVDTGPAKDAVVGALRASGFAAWRRTPKEGFSPHVHGIAVGDPTVSAAARNQVKAFFAGRNGLADNGPDTYMGGGGGAARWKGVVISVLKELKLFSGANVSNVLKAIAKESNGNPRAVNRGDVNARNGDPSKGLLQVIGSTFRAYAGKYKSRGQYDPYANIYAACNYAHHKYGKRWSYRMAAPGGYFAGIKNAPQGPAWVGEEGPELMNFRGGESVRPVHVQAGSGGGGDTYNFYFPGNVYAKSEREFEEMLAGAMQNLKKKGRLPK